MEKTTILTYGIYYDKSKMSWTVIEATRYDDETNEPTSWAVRRNSSVMSKIHGEFEFEPTPSNRNDEFFKEFRFDTPEQALECWKKFNQI